MPSNWDAMGMPGNQSGFMAFTDVTVDKDGTVGLRGDGDFSNNEALGP